MVEFAFGANRASMGKHDVLGNGEAEACASGFARARLVDTIEAFEEAWYMLRGNAGSEIANVKLDADSVRTRI